MIAEVRRADGTLIGRVVDHVRFEPDPSFGPADAPRLIEVVNHHLDAMAQRVGALRAWLRAVETNTRPGAGDPTQVVALIHGATQAAKEVLG